MVTFVKWYQGLIHVVPLVTTVSDLALTDMALEKSHWWIPAVALCPAYMICDYYGAWTTGGIVPPDEGRKGTIYGYEHWDTNVPYTIGLFVFLAAIQGGLFYVSCIFLEKVWPKREAEIFEGGAADQKKVTAKKDIKQSLI